MLKRSRRSGDALRAINEATEQWCETHFAFGIIRREMGLLHHSARADFAVLDAEALTLTLVEVKSEKDSLRRLPWQVEVFGRVAGKCVLVAAERHIAKAMAIVPEWWTIVAFGGGQANTIRHGMANPAPDPSSIAGLMWDGELRAELRARNIRAGRMRHREKCIALAERVSPNELRNLAFGYLRLRRLGQGGFGQC